MFFLLGMLRIQHRMSHGKHLTQDLVGQLRYADVTVVMEVKTGRMRLKVKSIYKDDYSKISKKRT